MSRLCLGLQALSHLRRENRTISSCAVRRFARDVSEVVYLRAFTSKNNNRRRPFERVRTLVSERNLILLAHDFYNFNPSEARLRKRPRGITFSTTISLREMFCFVFALSYKDKSKHTHRPLNVFVSKPVKLYQSVV